MQRVIHLTAQALLWVALLAQSRLPQRTEAGLLAHANTSSRGAGTRLHLALSHHKGTKNTKFFFVSLVSLW